MIGPTGPAGAGPNSRITPAGVICPILAVPNTVNHKLPSGPAAMPNGSLFAGRLNSVIAPPGLIRPIFPDSVNHKFPSGPAAIADGRQPEGGGKVPHVFAAGRLNSVIAPAGVIRPIRLPNRSVNHRLPSGPAVMRQGPLSAVGRGNSVITPAGVIRPILFPPISVNHKLPSGPVAIEVGPLFAERGNSASVVVVA